MHTAQGDYSTVEEHRTKTGARSLNKSESNTAGEPLCTEKWRTIIAGMRVVGKHGKVVG